MWNDRERKENVPRLWLEKCAGNFSLMPEGNALADVEDDEMAKVALDPDYRPSDISAMPSTVVIEEVEEKPLALEDMSAEEIREIQAEVATPDADNLLDSSDDGYGDVAKSGTLVVAGCIDESESNLPILPCGPRFYYYGSLLSKFGTDGLEEFFDHTFTVENPIPGFAEDPQGGDQPIGSTAFEISDFEVQEKPMGHAVIKFLQPETGAMEAVTAEGKNWKIVDGQGWKTVKFSDLVECAAQLKTKNILCISLVK